ncbi:calmodulin-like protein 3 [Dendrobium catenatum]|uniref:Putative calcium-binding protein CML17 n=1 Tax=Dendrobium catenatum TaxID=906689 RepID=A0A2I0VXS0_9ASPA|nr:calmodulin-like protein 3 [Dendrobium catenatum]PKU68211.1 putative calcium-binding protein CML17 [Dendrobium catenatum]
MELLDFVILQVVAITRCRIELTRFLSCDGDRHLFCNSRNDDIVISTDEIDDGGGGDQELTADDVTAVLERLGIECVERGREGKGVVEELLEEKEASEWELKEAFYVFDRNEDGFITAEELWNVMRRLGFEEGRRVKDCERMIRAFDEDGDGKISFLEFKRLLENTM